MCKNGRSYSIEVHPDGSNDLVECGIVKMFHLGECFRRTCRSDVPAERVVAGGDHLWAAVGLSSCPDRMLSCPCILRQRFFPGGLPDV